MQRNKWPIIVGGCHRSGTSLIRRVLDSHSRIYCGPEVKFFRDFYGDYFEDPIRHLRFTTSARTILPENDLLEVLGKAYITILEHAATQAGKSRWADKNPENVLYLKQWQRLLSDHWFMIHVTRNPLDTLASIKEVKFPLTIPLDLNERILFYRRYTQSGLDFGLAYPNRYYRVVYEQLVQSPRNILENLMEWLGEEFELDQLEFNRSPHQNGLEDSKVTETTEVHAESIERWKDILTDQEAEIIWNKTSDLWFQIDPKSDYIIFK